MGENLSRDIELYREIRREQFLEVAARVFLEHGPRRATMDQVAEHAGVSKVILYRYFGSKNKLIHEILSGVVDTILAADSIEVTDWTNRIPHTLHVARENRHAFRLLVRHAAHDPIFSVHFERVRDRIVEATIRRQSRLTHIAPEELKGTHLDFRFVADTVFGLFIDGYARWIEHEDSGEDELFGRWLTESVDALTRSWSAHARHLKNKN